MIRVSNPIPFQAKACLCLMLVGFSINSTAQETPPLDAECVEIGLSHGHIVRVSARPAAWTGTATVFRDTGFGEKNLLPDYEVYRPAFFNGEEFRIQAMGRDFEISGRVLRTDEHGALEAEGQLKAVVHDDGNPKIINAPVRCTIYRNQVG